MLLYMRFLCFLVDKTIIRELDCRSNYIYQLYILLIYIYLHYIYFRVDIYIRRVIFNITHVNNNILLT